MMATAGNLQLSSAAMQALVVSAADHCLLEDCIPVVQTKRDGSLVTDIDLALQQRLAEQLSDHWPEIPLLGEEMSVAEQRRIMSMEAFWCLDPLDGTTNFANGIPFYAVSLALIVQGEAVAGVVYDPSHREVFRADAAGGAWLNDQPMVLGHDSITLGECVAMVDLKRLPKPLLHRVASHPPYRSQRSLGAVALEWCWLAANRSQLYLHGAQRMWDYAAGLLIFREAGGCGCLLDLVTGECLEVDREVEAHAAIGASQAHLLREWREWLYEDAE